MLILSFQGDRVNGLEIAFIHLSATIDYLLVFIFLTSLIYFYKSSASFIFLYFYYLSLKNLFRDTMQEAIVE
jgi:hypothetical protein